jgi:threonine dehydrogenase-like Zn-dependent dehydrogenase
MKAIAVYPGQAQSAHIEELPLPKLENKYNGRGVLVKVLNVGLCGADREIAAGNYGTAPIDEPFLILGHESLGVVEAIGSNVSEVQPGDLVMAMVRRPGLSKYDLLGAPDMSTDVLHYECGINRLHGFLCEYYTDVPEFLIRVPAGLKHIGVLLEPLSIIEKGLEEVYHIQQRLPLWRPKHAAVLGAASVGLITTLLLRLRGINVATVGMPSAQAKNIQLVEQTGARYVSAQDMDIKTASTEYGPFDLSVEATGDFALACDAMQALAQNGVLLLCSVRGEGREINVPAHLINHNFVLGNKVMLGTVTANRQHAERGVRDMALAEMEYPGWLSQLITRRFDAFTEYNTALADSGGQDIKRVMDVA